MWTRVSAMWIVWVVLSVRLKALLFVDSIDGFWLFRVEGEQTL